MADKKTDIKSLPSGARRFSKKGEGFYKLKEGDSVRGIFLGVKEKDIRDIETGELKPTRIYSIQTNDGTIALSGRTLLDQCFDDACGSVGGWEKLCGKEIQFQRNEDVETEAYKRGRVDNKMSSYDIILY